MTTFEDGPAKGQHLSLRRAPIFLRVVEAAGKWDALDQPTDKPEPTEKIYAYRVHGEVGHCHIRSGKPGASGFYPIATYRFVEQQPTDQDMRDAAKWRAWCEQQKI